MVEGSTNVSLNVTYHNRTNFTKIISVGFYIWPRLTGERRHLKIWNTEKTEHISVVLLFTACMSLGRTSMALFYCVVPGWWLP